VSISNRMVFETSSRFKIEKGLLPLLILSLTTAPAFAANSTRTLSSHIPNAVKKMNDIGTADQNQVIPVTITLKLNNESELDNRISEMYRNGSPSFHQYLTPSEFKARYSPTEEQVAAETARLEAQGISVQSVSENRVLLHAQGTVAALNQMFATEIHQFQAQDGNVYFAPARELQAPVDSQIAAVVGLNNVTHFHNHLKLKSSLTSKTQRDGTTPGAAPGGGLAPADITTAYSIPNTSNGSGQTLALFELDGYDPTDITAYETQFNLPNVPLQNVLVDSSDGSAGQGAIEVVLDIEMMAAVAPSAAKILVYEGPNSSAGVIDTYAKIASDNLAQQISSSWGEAETQAAAADMQSENTVFKQMVAQGQALYSAAGDSGADDDGSTLSVDDPSGQPNVIGVGGTTLTMGTNSAYQSETTWNELASSEGAGGGGISKVWSIPSYQAGIMTANPQGSTTMRNVPDVSFNADPVSGYGIYQGGQWQVVGGTSASAPLWAAFTALVNQNRQAKGLSSIGFPANAIYAIGKGSNYATGFNDITQGTNGADSTAFSATAGFDNATGWGSFKGQALLNLLSTDAASSVESQVCSL
jgi:kumamolisin